MDQANIIYKRVRHVIDSNAGLSSVFKTTGTRGITAKDKRLLSSYVVKTGREGALQGIPITVCLADELHLWAMESWTAVVLGTSAQANGLVLGITTAGDDKSECLKHLYEVGRAAAAESGDYDERFGFFLWEAPAHLPVTDPAFLTTANPAIACGRLDLEQELNAVKTMPEQQARRYRGNQFVSSASSWMPASYWFGAPTGRWAPGRGTVIAVARSLNWRAATITATRKGQDGRVETQVVASLVNPTLDRLEDLCWSLWRRFKPLGFLMESADLKDLAMRLRGRRVPVEYLTNGQMMNVCATAYALLADGKVRHGGDPVVGDQVPKGVSKAQGDGWRVSRRDSLGDVDALLATLIGLYGAETMKPSGPALVVA